jgi:[phosphatase 2A protein]-leucine-carboxy methyltransferase
MLSHAQDADTAIRSTDSDAALARLSAVQKKYLEDPFIKYLVPRAHFQPPRPPLINIGTHARASAIDELVNQWITLSKSETGLGCQIVSLGAGSDTRFWRIALDEQTKQQPGSLHRGGLSRCNNKEGDGHQEE